MTYAGIMYVNKNNCDFIQNKCRIQGLCNENRTCMLEYEDGRHAVIDIVNVIREINEGRLAVTNLSSIRRHLERFCSYIDSSKKNNNITKCKEV